MKNLKNYFAFTLIALFAGALFFSCSNDSDVVDNKNVQNSAERTALSSREGSIDCWISGLTVTNAHTSTASSSVNAGSTVTYQYNSSPAVTNIQWTVVSGTGITFVGSTTNSTVTVSFSSAFNGGSIQAVGTDADGQICGPVLPIIKLTEGNGGVDCSCLPVFKTQFIQSTPSTNRFSFSFVDGDCDFDWSKVYSVEIELNPEFPNSCAILSNTYNNWTNTATNILNKKILINNNTSTNVPPPGGLFNSMSASSTAEIDGQATIVFKNNSCPTQTIYINNPDVIEP